jgi:hypothetical protein
MRSSFVVTGAIVGILAGMVMAMYAMIASATFLAQGFFTPLYGIATPIVGSEAMLTSMRQGLYFAHVPALAGLVVHMMWSAFYGAIFGVLASRLQLAATAAVVVGMLYGVAVMIAMSFIVLPIVAAGAMPGMIGWPSFTVEHLMFGLVLGLWLAVRPADVVLQSAGATS